MKVTQAMLVMMLFLGGCDGCSSCGQSQNAPGGGQVPKAAEKPAQAPAPTAAATINAGAATPSVAAEKPTARPPIEAGAAPPAAKPPQAAAPEAADSDDDDCIVIGDANPDYGPPPLAVAFSAEAECSGGDPKYDWDFGDGSPHSNEANPSHTYAKAGEFTATVTVTGRGEATANDELDITVETEEGEGGDAQ